ERITTMKTVSKAGRSLLATNAALIAAITLPGDAMAKPVPNNGVCSARYSGPLATEDQIAAETRALRIIERPEIKALRPSLRELLMQDPAAKLPDGVKEIDRAIDLWTMALAMREVNADAQHPKI